MQNDVFELFSEIYKAATEEEMSLQQYLLSCREDRSMYASAPERMMAAIRELGYTPVISPEGAQ